MKQVADYLQQFDRCLADEPAFCTAVCPFRLDVREFTERIEQGRVAAAYGLYRDSVGFPKIVAKLCSKPCEAVCPLAGGGDAVALSALESFAVESAGSTPPNDYNLPPRSGRIAIIGAGIAGLGCALVLARQKYSVEVFEATGEIGGGAWGEFKDEALAEIARQFQNETYELHLNARIKTRAELNAQGFDAVFVATGKGGADFELLAPQADSEKAFCLTDARPENLATAESATQTQQARGGLSDLSQNAGIAWFAGGALIGSENAEALAQGLFAATAIDAFLRTGKLVYANEKIETKLTLGAVERKQGSFRADAPEKEAARCMRCRCDACMRYADLPAYTGKWPRRIRDEVFATTLPAQSEVKATPAKRLLHMDNLSGVFETICPAGIDLDGLLLAGRQSLHRQEKAPWAFHEFHLRDMAHADGETAALTLPYESKANANTERIAFFPGCQLGASEPELVLAAWEKLKELDESGLISLAGLLLRCCGAPAEWAGDEALFEQKLAEIRREWQALGGPALALACPSCMRLFEKHLPEIKIVSVYEILASAADTTNITNLANATSEAGSPNSPNWAVFDACAAARLTPEKTVALKESVRTLAQAAGLAPAELPIQSEISRCCGFGGQPDMASPEFAAKVAKGRAEESELPYVCYCSNCRDAFVRAGKPAIHILETLLLNDRHFGLPHSPDGSLAMTKVATATERRENREWLKAMLTDAKLQEGKSYNFTLQIDEKLLAQMDKERILVNDALAVAEHMQKTRESIYNPAEKTHSGFLQIGKTTFWVSYTKASEKTADGKDALILTNIYTHRIAFVPEQNWNALPKWTAGAQTENAEQTLICEKCDVDMELIEAEFDYLSRTFRHQIMRCPKCGAPYIPESLARGRMREVEMALEDK